MDATTASTAGRALRVVAWILGALLVLALAAFAYLIGVTHQSRVTQQVWVGCCACAADAAEHVPDVRNMVPPRPLSDLVQPARSAPAPSPPRTTLALPAAGPLPPLATTAPEALGTMEPLFDAAAVPMVVPDRALCAGACAPVVSTPEPTGAGLMLLGVAAAGGLAWRRRRTGGAQ